MTKISNITKGTNFPKDINIPLVDGSTLTLKPGEFLFVENIGNNSTLRVYEKKQIISITQEEKPESLSYLKVYNVFDLLKDVSLNIGKAHNSLREEVINDERFPKELREKFANIKDEETNQSTNVENELNTINSEESVSSQGLNKEEEITIEIIVPEGSVKNKGGRPKGSFKKERRGRPKKKGTPGRPKKKVRPTKKK